LFDGVKRGGGLGLLLAGGILAAGSAMAAGSLSDYRLLVLDGTTVKWGAPVLGQGATITYAVVARDQAFPGARNCAGIVPMDQLLRGSAVPRPRFDAELKAAFAAWSAVADVIFRPADPAAADILIGAEARPRGWAFTNVAYDHDPDAKGPHQIGQSVICLNPEKRWKIGFDGNLEVYDLRYTLEHEIGHAIGLDHPSGFADLMGFRYLELFRTPQKGDIAGAVALYGPPDAPVTIAARQPAPQPAASRTAPAAVQPRLGLGRPQAD
jgi:hypothetical protein